MTNEDAVAVARTLERVLRGDGRAARLLDAFEADHPEHPWRELVGAFAEVHHRRTLPTASNVCDMPIPVPAGYELPDSPVTG